MKPTTFTEPQQINYRKHVEETPFEAYEREQQYRNFRANHEEDDRDFDYRDMED